MIKLRKFSALLIVLAFAAGCANNNEAEPRRYQEPRFTDQAPIDLKVTGGSCFRIYADVYQTER